jgi:hypothetical protein
VRILHKSVAVISGISLALGFALSLLALLAAWRAYADGMIHGVTDWRHTTYWWLITSDIAFAVSLLLTTAGYGAVFLRKGSNLAAPLFYGASCVLFGMASYVTFRIAGKMGEAYWPSVLGFGVLYIAPALSLSLFLLLLNYRTSTWNGIAGGETVAAGDLDQ